MSEWICKFYASHAEIPEGHHDGVITRELIRCKDCIQWDKYDLMPRDADGKERHHCPHIGTDTDEYFFCRDGEKEEE